LDSSGDYETDCDKITRIFSKGVPLHPKLTFYGCKTHRKTSVVDWYRLGTVIMIVFMMLCYVF
jgi:hypothetical protein